jgi:dipeptidyl aminopeptidase/acylaminoacyl peptidase
MALSNGVVQDLIGGTPEEMPERYATASPIELLPLGVRQVLVHGTEDENVPFEISRAYYKAALSKGDDCELITLQGAGHFEVIDPSTREWQQVAGAVKKALA